MTNDFRENLNINIYGLLLHQKNNNINNNNNIIPSNIEYVTCLHKHLNLTGKSVTIEFSLKSLVRSVRFVGLVT